LGRLGGEGFWKIHRLRLNYLQNWRGRKITKGLVRKGRLFGEMEESRIKRRN